MTSPETSPLPGIDPGHEIVIVGAGPAGLTAAYQLSKAGVSSTVVEADDVVGGISRTVERDGWRFDIGGHRFFTKVPEVETLWHEILPDEDFLLRPRMSRIYYNNRFFDYPLRAMNALKGLGLVEATRCVGSYVWARVRKPADTTTFEGWTASALRLAALSHLLQDLHREGVGCAGLVHPGRLGRPAHQEPLVGQGHRQLAPAQAEPDRRHLAHRGVPVPEVRARDDVGGLPGQGGRGGDRRADVDRGGRGSSTPADRPTRSRSPAPTASSGCRPPR